MILVKEIVEEALDAMIDGKTYDNWVMDSSITDDYDLHYLKEVWDFASYLKSGKFSNDVDTMELMFEINSKEKSRQKEKNWYMLFVTILLRIGYLLFIIGMIWVDNPKIREDLIFFGLIIWVEFGDLRAYMRAKY